MYTLGKNNPTTHIKRTLIASFALIAALIVSIAPALPVSAASVTDTTATGEVIIQPGQSFILTLTTDGDSDISTLGVRHNLESAFPAFSAAANEADPYPGGGGQEYFESLGASLAYDAATYTWTIDFGESVTQQLMGAGDITFYLGLYDNTSTLLWGSSDEAEATEANTFSYTLVEGSEENGEDETADSEDGANGGTGSGSNNSTQEPVIIPKVPNTGFQPETSHTALTAVGVIAAAVVAAGGTVVGILRRRQQ